MGLQDPQWETIERPDQLVRDMDALHILPLKLLPLDTTALKELKLVKNHRLKSVVEVFTVRRTRSAQVEINDLPQYFGWHDDEPHPDLPLLRQVGGLPSFDLYSLRHLLRGLDFLVDDFEELRVPESAAHDLGEYMTVFTRPLISRLYGDETIEIAGHQGLLALFADPDHAKVRRRLKLMADELGIRMEAVPRFLEDYGDLLMSLAYLRRCLDELTPIVSEFLGTMDTVRSNELLQRDEALMEICAGVEGDVNELTAAVAGRFKALDQMSRDIESGALRFRDVDKKVGSHHASVSGVLCGLTVKMKVWDQMFPDKSNTSPAQMADFIKYHMKQGLEEMQDVRVQTDTA